MTENALARIEPLKMGRYAEWESNMTAWLCSKGWFTVVSGTYNCPSPAIASQPTKEETAEIDWWEEADEHATGTIGLTLSPTERAALQPHLGSSVVLWREIKKRHLANKPTARYNAYTEFFNLRLTSGEKLEDFASRVVEAMRRIQDCRPSTYDIKTFDPELMSIAIICALSKEPSCRTLVATLLGDDARLTDVAKMRERLISEDIRRDTTPALYGLVRKKGKHGVLLVDSTTTTNSANVVTTRGNRPAEKEKKDKPDPPKCTFCNGRHDTDKCYQKRIADGDKRIAELEKRLDAGPKVCFATTESAGSATTARAFRSPSSSDDTDDLWIADTGATAHMTPHREFFVTYELCSTPVRLADGNVVHAAGVGTVAFVPYLDGIDMPAVGFTRTLHVPGLKCNLLSVLFLVRHKEFVARAEGTSMTFSRAGSTLFTARITDACAAHLDGHTPGNASAVTIAYRATVPLDLGLWHRRTMHHHIGGLERAIRKKLVTGMTIDSRARPDPICEPCLAGKMHAHLFRSTGTVTTGILDLVHGDLVSMPVRTQSGYKYFVAFHDDASGFHAAYPLRAKSDTFEAFCVFKAFAET